jgi:hypothetical protein
MAIIQPRVARNELPWVTGPLSFLNPERVGSNMVFNSHDNGLAIEVG